MSTTTWAKVFAQRWWLDRRLADGERADHDEALELRARQLTGEKSRRVLARSLVRTIELAQEPNHWGPHVPVDRRAVTEARLQLFGLAARLADDEPVGARGVAMIRELLF